MDPAGPLFENYPDDAGLSPDDAIFVDVIHSMGQDGFIMDFGTLKPMGDLDFYPNGGVVQVIFFLFFPPFSGRGGIITGQGNNQFGI